MRYLLDTNIASYLVKATFPALDRRFQSLPPSATAVSAVTEAEMRLGLALLPPEAKLHRLTNALLDSVMIEAWDTLCAKRYAQLAVQQRRTGKPLSYADTMIAAHALAHDFTLVTHDAAFARIPGLRIEDWTQGPVPA